MNGLFLMSVGGVWLGEKVKSKLSGLCLPITATFSFLKFHLLFIFGIQDASVVYRNIP